MDTMLPITAADLSAIPRARATRLSFNWGDGRQTVWIDEASFSIVTDYGQLGVEAVVTSPRTRDNCIAALADYVFNYGEAWKGYDLRVEAWESVSVLLNAWITQTHNLGCPWAPLPE